MIEVSVAAAVVVLAAAPFAAMALRPAPAPAATARRPVVARVTPSAPASVGPTTAGAGRSTASTRGAGEPAVASRPAPAASRQAAVPQPRPKPKASAAPKPEGATAPVVQRFRLAIGAVGYEPDRIVAKAGAPVELTVARGEGCASGFALPDLDVLRDNSKGPVTVRLAALKPGSYTFTCGMGMVTGTLVVR